MAKINQKQLAKVHGVGDEAAEAVASLFDSLEQLAGADSKKLAKVASITDEQAEAVCNWAEIKVSAGSSKNEPAEAPAKQKEEPGQATFANRLGIDVSTLAILLAGGEGSKHLFGMVGLRPLLAAYDPREPDGLAASVLAGRFGREPVIAFKGDMTTVAVDESAQYINDRRKGFPPLESVEVDGRQARLYQVGVEPENFQREDPLAHGQPVRPDGQSSYYRDVSYKGVPYEAMQFMRIAVDQAEISPRNRADRREIVGIARDQGLEGLEKEYSHVALSFKEQKRAGILPKLQVELGGNQSVGGDFFADSHGRRQQENGLSMSSCMGGEISREIIEAKIDSLNPRNQLDTLMSRMGMPERFRPGHGALYEREPVFLDWVIGEGPAAMKKLSDLLDGILDSAVSSGSGSILKQKLELLMKQHALETRVEEKMRLQSLIDGVRQEMSQRRG